MTSGGLRDMFDSLSLLGALVPTPQVSVAGNLPWLHSVAVAIPLQENG